MPKFSDMLSYLRKRSSLSQQELADATGLTRSAIGMYETGKREPDFETLEIFADYFNVSMDVLTGRSGEGSAPTSRGVLIPVLGSVAAGIPIEAVEDILDYEEITPELAASGDFFALKIKGQSMEPRMLDGDVVIVRRQDDADTGDIAVVLVNGDEATVKKIRKQTDGLSLIPINPIYEVMFYTPEKCRQLPVRIIGKVVELRGKM